MKNSSEPAQIPTPERLLYEILQDKYNIERMTGIDNNVSEEEIVNF
jgi:hypothetical protein